MEQPFTNMRSLVRAFARAMNLISPEVQDHHQKVAYFAWCLAEAMELPEAQRQMAVYGALFHDIGAVALEQEITLQDVERNAGKLAKTGSAMLKLLPATKPLSEVVQVSQTPWRGLKTFVGHMRAPFLIGQIVHLSDTVSLLLGEDAHVLNRVAYIRDCIRNTKGEYAPDVLASFEELCRKDAVWMDLLYSPDRFLEFLPLNQPVSLEETRMYTELVSQMIDFRSPFTAMHSAGVAASAVCLAELAGMSETEQRMMQIAGNLHDLGNLKISREILEKPGKLTEEEFNIIKEHAYFTYVILKDVEGFASIAAWAALHHEKLNGSGYPFRLDGSRIPLGARIMAVADIFSAVTEVRPYRKGMKKEDAVRVLRENVDSGGLSGGLVELLVSHYETVDDARDKASRKAGKRYFDSISCEKQDE